MEDVFDPEYEVEIDQAVVNRVRNDPESADALARVVDELRERPLEVGTQWGPSVLHREVAVGDSTVRFIVYHPIRAIKITSFGHSGT